MKMKIIKQEKVLVNDISQRYTILWCCPDISSCYEGYIYDVGS